MNNWLRPRFLDTRALQVSVDTSGYCQARCPSCAWITIPRAQRTMSLDEFHTILSRFDGYEFVEFGFNSINEPFADRSILDKIGHFLDRGLKTNVLFFSSNWLAASPDRIERFGSLMQRALAKGTVTHVAVNATISGIDDDSYDIQQAGRELEASETIHDYRPLSFDKAKENVIDLVRALSPLLGKRAVLNIKSYGPAIDNARFAQFWRDTLAATDIDPRFAARHVRFLVNHGFTTFARGHAGAGLHRQCSANWLIDQIVVGYDGRVGLCCQEGARQADVGNLLTHTLEEVVASKAYQAELAIVSGAAEPSSSHQCAHCEFFQQPQAALQA
jgi:radical SAM protein with 4Fe4S-binding SPASM domain